ncbi:hypothetical protein [Terrabacter sp. 2YAF2]|uniref:hypothetical protein n=1 Tax=Terrabacter sp. 2YAF2 TaxID=3233026 RepID=UPI003F994309
MKQVAPLRVFAPQYVGTSDMPDTSHGVTHETADAVRAQLPAPRTRTGRVVHSRAATIVFGSLWWLYGLWLAWIAFQARDSNWLWLFYAGLAAAVFGGRLLRQVQWVFDRSSEVARGASRCVVFGLAIAGFVASAAQFRLATLIVLALVGPAAVVWFAERNVRLQERSRQLSQEVEFKQGQVDALKQGTQTAEVLNALMRVNLELMRLAALDEVRRRNAHPPLAGHRKGRRRVYEVQALWEDAQAKGAQAAAVTSEQSLESPPALSK